LAALTAPRAGRGRPHQPNIQFKGRGGYVYRYRPLPTGTRPNRAIQNPQELAGREEQIRFLFQRSTLQRWVQIPPPKSSLCLFLLWCSHFRRSHFDPLCVGREARSGSHLFQLLVIWLFSIVVWFRAVNSVISVAADLRKKPWRRRR
jgi:hypothetical protein